MKNGPLATAMPVAVALLAVLSLPACRKDRTPPSPEPTVEVPAQRQQPLDEREDEEEAPAQPPSPAESCVDAWLSERSLDRYGHPQGTMYTGGTPLFDERTGESTPRLEYVFRKHPDAHAACAPDLTLPERLPEK